MSDYIDCITPYLESHFEEVHPMDFYRAVFPEGVLQEKGYQNYHDGRYNGLLVELTNRYRPYIDPKTKAEKKRRVVKRYSITESLEELSEVMNTNNFCLMSPLAYAGKTREAKNARIAFGIAIDLDRIRVRDGYAVGLENFFHQTRNDPGANIGSQPLPTFVVSSGTGCHLYYLFEKPICLFEETVNQLQKLKRAMTTKTWHDSVVDIKDERDIQQEGIFQGFRVVGTITKVGTRTRAFAVGGRVSIDYLNQFVSKDNKVEFYREFDQRYLLSKEPYPKQLTLEEAMEIGSRLNYWKNVNPDWYERRVVNKEPRKTWAVNRALYDWWKEEIRTKARVNHRYWCISMLAIYAVKCSHYDSEKNPNPVTYDELERDAFDFVALFDKLTVEEDNHFTDADVLAALEFWNDSWAFYKRDYMAYRAGFDIKATKRNGRSREDHLELCRVRKEQKKRRGELIGEGRPTKRKLLTEWRLSNPQGTKTECKEETGMSYSTIAKWWDDAEETMLILAKEGNSQGIEKESKLFSEVAGEL